MIVESVLLFVNHSNVDISSEGRNCLPLSIVGDDLRNSPVTGGVPADDGLRRPVPALPCWARAAVTAVPGLPQVALTGGVGLPSAVNGAERVNILPGRAVKPTSGVEESLGAISGDGWAGSWYLLVNSRIVFNAAGNVCPSAVILTQRNIVSAEITDNIARLTREGF